MKKSAVLLSLLFLGGIALIVVGFLLFVPPERRTDVAKFDLGLVLWLYVLFFGRFLPIFLPLGKFADRTPFFSMWWMAFGAYSVFCIGGMIVLGVLGVSFVKQLFAQSVVLFFFLCSMAVGVLASGWMSRSTQRDRQVMDGVRGLQQMAVALGIGMEGLSQASGECRNVYRQVLDDINTLAGSTSSRAPAMESRIAELINRATAEMAEGASEDSLLKTGRELRMAVAMRKSV